MYSRDKELSLVYENDDPKLQSYYTNEYILHVCNRYPQNPTEFVKNNTFPPAVNESLDRDISVSNGFHYH